ncbi:MAG: efflux transporter outer membrane subunit [Curvibacter lanceolatus]|uniref:efflux transporter outer membrane subunit n=1 Tax=Curvibacter lanceolatus TaxID=86182 RepID=UPI00235788DA|nr:efflux transporter outer membrane subunit [Curvibacter lanceolatus]MBV5291485.1 efflux transporter outer membrane subunit [Curvibacter lanceolatus]
MNGLKPCLALCALLATGGCTVGPDFQRPADPATTTYGAQPLPAQTESAPGPAGLAQRFAPGQQVPSQWWKAFGSPALDELVAAALQANPDLQAAQAALRAAHESVAAQRGAYWPSADIGLNSTRQRVSSTLSGPLADSDTTLYTLRTAQLSVGYVPDVFGANRRQVEALTAAADMRTFEREAVYQTLVASVVGAAFEQASLRAQLAATHQLIGLADRLLDIARRQHRAGQASGADIAAQEAALAQAQAALPSLERQLSEQTNRLAVLLGRLPSEMQQTPQTPQTPLDLASLTLPRELPLSLPSRLVEQRPDVRAALAQWQAASAQVGVAVAARLPSITLSASLGSSALDMSQLLRSGGFWSVGANLAQPVFRGGALLHQQRAAEAAYAQAEAQYRSTVLTAFQNTADTLQAIVSGAQALRAASAAEAAAQKSLAMARRQRALGAATQADLILAEQACQQASLARVQAQAGRYTNTVALYQALGGWWSASVPPARPPAFPSALPPALPPAASLPAGPALATSRE